jgi:hypothetical protein
VRNTDFIAKLKALDYLAVIDYEVTGERGVHDQGGDGRPVGIDTTVDLAHIRHKRPQLKPFVSCPSTG